MNFSKATFFGVLMTGTILTAPLWQGGIANLFAADTASASNARPVQAMEDVFVQYYPNDVPQSLTIKQDLPFALPKFPLFTKPNAYEAPIQMDINADGLSDLVFSNISLNGTDKQVVMLNNGNGFDVV